jgi:hypothetical protein
VPRASARATGWRPACPETLAKVSP